MTLAADNRTVDRYPTRVTGEFALLRREDPVVFGRPGEGPCDADTLAGFDQNGFLTVEELLTAEEVAHCSDELRRLGESAELESDERVIVEPGSQEIRSVFEVHKISERFADLVRDPRVVRRARQILGSEVYVHQSRVNFKPGLDGKEFYWHSDFETWHAEDGMPAPRAVSISIALTDNHHVNSPLMIMPGSHRTFVACVGETPDDHHKESLRRQEIGTPDPVSLVTLGQQHGIVDFPGPAGSAVMFDSNCMHGSNSNITPFARSNVFIVFNSTENTLIEPFAASRPRPEHIASRKFTPVS
ncbi:MAG: ectoine hydroxylase [Carbonactinosporaceae bacterium]